MPEDVSSTEPPEEYETESVSEQSSEGVGTSSVEEKTLLLKDCNPWTTRANELVLEEMDAKFDILNSSSLAETDLGQYDTVILPSTQDETYYRRLRNESDAIDSFVSDGGTLVAHVTDSGWPCTTRASISFLPRGVGKINWGSNSLDRITTDHPVVDGVSDEALDDWGASAHGYLTDLPEDATEIVGVGGDEDRPTYAEYGHSDGRVLVTMQTIEWPWYVGDGTKTLLRNELEYALSDRTTSVSASVTTLQFIPGENENVSEGGYPLDGGLMEVFRENETIKARDWFEFEVPADPVLDSWLKGDQTAVDDDVRPGNDELPTDLKQARDKVNGKYSDEFGTDAYGIYRFGNGVGVSFETSDGRTVDEDSIEITFNESGADPVDERISLEGRENPMSVTPGHEVNGIPVDEWHGSLEERSNRKRRHYEYQTDFEFDGVEGVRVLTISGGYAGFVADWAERVGNSPPSFFSTVWEWGVNETIAQLAWLAAPPQAQFLADYLTVVPNTYSFIEFIVLADGRRYARVWDASQYPSLAMYVDGERRTLEKMPYRPRERFNLWLTVFQVQASAGITPYHTPLDYYGRLINDGNEEQFEAILGDEVERVLELLPVGWSVADFLPRIPRETVGFRADGTPVDDPNAPYDATTGLLFPWAGTIESE